MERRSLQERIKVLIEGTVNVGEVWIVDFRIVKTDRGNLLEIKPWGPQPADKFFDVDHTIAYFDMDLEEMKDKILEYLEGLYEVVANCIVGYDDCMKSLKGG